eukprot:CAMPEP_0113729636 /NCGR_PEP_ID=MMETSP0038_2-20120614/42674_1 /TAXON_ID=2898 /ORGANISM="Cryptomonas paramecium" /LENGTH=1415 /DNA_ID=CAMNT_0000661529 /DNA_START=107 /DNA_END=4352 /DNA_ORIENTATION=+ /assembly_acc=CAM_ASM_000170
MTRAEEDKTRQQILWTSVLMTLQREKRTERARGQELYIKPSLFIFPANSKIREFAIKLTEWQAFDQIVLLGITLNCVLLALEDPVCRCKSSRCTAWDRFQQSLYSRDCSGWPALQALLDGSEVAFACFFTFEMAAKILARGFVMHKHAYLREPWNWLDFVVVVASLVSLLPTVNISVLRTFRVLRPLRTLSRIKSMKPILITLSRALRSIVYVWAVLALFLCIFGILSVELMAGTLRGYCYFDPRPGRNNFTDAAYSRLISQQTPFLAEQDNNLGGWNVYVQTCRPDDEEGFGPSSGYICPPMPIDGVTYATTCSTKKWCGTDWCINDWNSNPLDFGAGFLNYDNIASAIVTNFQSMTFASWNDLQYRMANGSNIWLSRLYHTLWVFTGAFVVMQLVLAVLNESFDQAQEEQRTERAREALSEESILVPPGLGMSGGHRNGRACSIVGGFHSSKPRDNRDTGLPTDDGQEGKWYLLPLSTVSTGWAQGRRLARIVARSPWFHRVMSLVIVANFVCLAMESHDQDLFEDSICRRRCGGDPRLPPAAKSRCHGPLFNRSWTFDGQGGGTRPNQEVFCFIDRDAEIAGTDWAAAGGEFGASNCSLAQDVNSCTNAGASCGWVRGRCMLGVYSAISFAVNVSGSWTIEPNRSLSLSMRDLCGSISEMGQLCPNYPQYLSDSLEAANYIFTLIFVLELLVKLMAMGFMTKHQTFAADIRIAGEGRSTSPGYFSDLFNWLDFVIVISSAIESAIKFSGGSKGAGNALTSLRALRILRLFRLIRNWKGMQDILQTLQRSLTSIWPLFVLILLFTYIFALLGMQLFGGKFRFFKTDAPRSNFDSFLPGSLGHGAVIAVFQLMSLENWDNVMSCGMLGLSMTQANSLFFMVTVLIGNFMFMNLFTSILLQFIGETAVSEDEAEKEAASAAAALGPMARAAAVSRAAFRFLEGKPLSRLRQRNCRVAPQPPPGSDIHASEPNEEDMPAKSSEGFGAGMTNAGANGVEASVMDVGSVKLGRSQPNVRVEILQFPSVEQVSTNAAPSTVEASLPVELDQKMEQQPGGHEHAVRPSGGHGITRREIGMHYGERMLFGRKVQCSVADHNAFFVLGPSNPLRLWAAAVSKHSVVEGLMLVIILASSITLLLESPDDIVVSSDKNCPPAPGFLDCSGASTLGQADMVNCPREDGPFFGKAFPPCGSQGQPGCCSIKAKMAILVVLDIIFTIVFFIEMVLKIVADGLIMHPKSYLRDGWNLLDCIVVIVSVMSAFGTGSAKDLKALRTLRAFRPLRVIKSNPGLRVAVNSLLKSLPAMANVSLVVLFWLVVYSLLGVQLFKGCFFRCYDYSTQFVYGSSIFPLSNNIFSPTPRFSGPEAVPSIVECVAANGGGTTAWSNRPFGFDNIFRALLTLFEMLTTTGWLEMLQSMVD